MKYLSDYINEETTRVLRETDSFFAFGEKQFNEQKKDGVKYTSCGMGLICPTENLDIYIKEMDEVIKKGIAQDIKENGKENIIKRELANHEAYYTYDLTSTEEALWSLSYGITKDEIREVFNREKQNHKD